MRVVFPTTTIASIGGAAYLATVNAVTDSVGIAYEKPGSIRVANTAAKTQKGSECSFEEGVLTMTPDVGVLFCGTGEMCVEDSTSQFGGRCVALEENLTVESQRELECEKCTGTNACPVGVNQTNIGCGSCIGKLSCHELPDNVIIGENSCVGDGACRQIEWSSVATLTIGDYSCRDGSYACYHLGAPVGTNSCIGHGSCQAFTEGSIGSGSCTSTKWDACAHAKGFVGNYSCNGEKTCFFRYGDTGNNSCNGFKACYWITGEVDIGDQSCNLDQSCSFSKVDVGFYSCNGKKACYKVYYTDVGDCLW